MFRFLFLSILLMTTVTIYPTEIMKDFVVTSLFGDSRTDHFHTGIDLFGVAESVRAVEDLEVVFMNKNRKGSIKYGNGNFILLEHKKTNIRYNYSHLSDKSCDEKRTSYKKGEIVGVSGDTGHSTGSHLHLEIEDIKNKRLENPIKLLSITDTKKPVIQDIFFISNLGDVTSLYDTRSIVRGGKLFIKCVDFIDGYDIKLTPYEIDVFIDGDEFYSMKFDFLNKKDDNLCMTGSDKRFEELYSTGEDFVFFLKEKNFLPGIYGIKVVVKDYKGNADYFITSFRVRSSK